MRFKILIGNLPVTTTEESLLNWLCDVQQEITVSVKLNDSGVCMGFATVETRSENIARLIMDEYDRTDFGGRRVFMNLDSSESLDAIGLVDKIKNFFGFHINSNQIQ